jgi:ATP adenylyltransferase
MKQIWAPWRIEYILGKKDGKGCFLCDKSKEKNDEKNFILCRGKTCFIIANTFPYNGGHMMVSPYRHVTDVADLSKEERSEIMELTVKCVEALKKWAKPHGFNIGINLGRSAGAGETHIHQHVVPRWDGDTNFMPILADVKVLPEHLAAICKAIKKHIK